MAAWRATRGRFRASPRSLWRGDGSGRVKRRFVRPPSVRPRNHPDAVQLFGVLAQAMKRAVADVGVQSLLPGDWRQPFIDGRTKQEHSLDRLLGPWHSVTEWRWCRRRRGRFRALPFRTSLYEAVGQGGRIAGLLCFFVRAQSVSRPERGMPNAPRAGAVKPDRRSPPEAARSGLDGGERGARLARLGRSVRRPGRANMTLDWASSKRGLAASPCIRSGAMARNPNPSCNDEGAAHERRDPSERAGASPWIRAVTRLSFVTSAGGMARRSEARREHGGRRRFRDSATAPPSASAPRRRWRCVSPGLWRRPPAP